MVISAILTQNSRKFGLSTWQLVTDLGWNHQICTKHVSWDTLSWYWKWRPLTLTFKAIFAFLTQNLTKIWLVQTVTCSGFELESPNLHLRILSTGIENGDHWPWPSRSFGYFDSEFQETAFKVALIYWSRPPRDVTCPRLALVSDALSSIISMA